MEHFLYQDLYQLEDKHWWHRAKRQLVLEALDRFVKPTKKKVLLDLGCGTGKNVEAFSSLVEAHGIDISAEAIKFCKKRGLKHVRQANIAATKLKKESVDIVTMLDVLEHVDEKPVLSEVKRILKKDGWLIITVPAFEWLWSEWDEVLHHKRRYTKKTLQQALNKHGFYSVKTSYVYSFLVLPAFVIRWIKSRFGSGTYQSDFKMSSTLINQIGKMISMIERKIIWKWDIPFGTSLVVIARKHEN